VPKGFLKRHRPQTLKDSKGQTTITAVEKEIVADQQVVITDRLGREVPDDLVPEWQRAERQERSCNH